MSSLRVENNSQEAKIVIDRWIFIRFCILSHNDPVFRDLSLTFPRSRLSFVFSLYPPESVYLYMYGRESIPPSVKPLSRIHWETSCFELRHASMLHEWGCFWCKRKIQKKKKCKIRNSNWICTSDVYIDVSVDIDEVNERSTNHPTVSDSLTRSNGKLSDYKREPSKCGSLTRWEIHREKNGLRESQIVSFE